MDSSFSKVTHSLLVEMQYDSLIYYSILNKETKKIVNLEIISGYNTSYKLSTD
jgi:hypothetical protein